MTDIPFLRQQQQILFLVWDRNWLVHFSGQSYKPFVTINYDDRKIGQFSSQCDSRVVIYNRKLFIRLVTDRSRS